MKRINIVDAAKEYIRYVEDVRSGNREKHIMSTGLEELDELLDGGFEDGQLIVIGGRPGDGKSALGLQLADKAAHNGRRVIYLNLEMRIKDIMKRLLARRSAAFTRISEADMGLLREKMNDIVSMDMEIIDDASTRIEDFRDAIVENSDSEHPIGLVVVDYLQLMRSKQKFDRKDLEIGEISMVLKEIAKTISAPVVALAQLNRPPQQGSKIPSLERLRESGQIEQDADVVIFTYFSEAKNSHVLKVAKNRNGEMGSINVDFNKERQTFTCASEGW